MARGSHARQARFQCCRVRWGGRDRGGGRTNRSHLVAGHWKLQHISGDHSECGKCGKRWEKGFQVQRRELVLGVHRGDGVLGRVRAMRRRWVGGWAGGKVRRWAGMMRRQAAYGMWGPGRGRRGDVLCNIACMERTTRCKCPAVEER
eukprot:227402-Chlamydomonas_euryale.AAC.3